MDATSPRRRTLTPTFTVTAALALVAVLVATPVAGATSRTYAVKAVRGTPTPFVGIADQKLSMFAHERFAGLGIRRVRRTVPWDVMRHPFALHDVEQWLAAAQRAGAEPLIVFARSRVDGARHRLPTVEQFLRAFRSFRGRFPEVRHFSTWNEANHGGEPTFRRPDVAARFYTGMKRACRSCTVLAADLLDQPNAVRWARRFVAAAGHEPRYWGLHNYISANRFDLGRTRALLRAVKGQVWLTEVGGLVKRRNRSTVRLQEGSAHAQRVTRFIFDRLLRLDRRLSRIYLYHWDAETTRDTWDSALFNAYGRPRRAFATFEDRVRRIQRVREARARARG